MIDSLRATLFHRRRDTIGLILLLLIGLALFLPMMLHWRAMGDYETHNQIALLAVQDLAYLLRNTPHFLYHVFTGGLHALLSIDINIAGAWVMVLSELALLMIVYVQIRRLSQLPPALPVLLVTVLVALGLGILMPINFFTGENLYFGYFAPHVYHNPTIILMKPFSVLLFFGASYLYGRKQPLTALWALPFALLTALSLFAKPSFIMVFVPALGVITAYMVLRILLQGRQEQATTRQLFGRMLDRRQINWPVLIGGIVLPAFVILLIQTLTWTSSGGIGVDPFRVFFEWTLHYEPNADQQILLKLLTSIAFPLLVYSLHWRDTRRSLLFNLAWVMFAISAAFAYLLVDYTQIAAGDFTWSSQIAVLILHMIAAVFLFAHYGDRLLERNLTTMQWLTLMACAGVFALHVISGIYWYHLHRVYSMGDLIYRWW